MSIWQLKTDSSRCSNIHKKFKSMTLRHFNFLCYSTPMSNPWDESKGLKLHLCFVLTLRRMKMILELCLVVALLSVIYARSFPMFSFIYVRQWMADLELGGGGWGRSFCRLPYRLFFPLRMLYSSSYQCYFVWLVLLENWTERQNIWVKFSNNEIKRVMAIFFPESFS